MEIYELKTAGHQSEYSDYADAIFAADRLFGQAAIVGHSGDISDGGTRTLIWESEEQAANDDGSRAVAVITKREVPFA